jgi:cytochrome P450
MDVIADFADLLPATVTAELMGVPVEDRDRLKSWSKDFSEMLGNFQHNPGRVAHMLKIVETDDGPIPRPDPRTGTETARGRRACTS